ncbi:MAG: hypothetical protein ABJ004_16965 [Cyclobacteriaceae bacterium]
MLTQINRPITFILFFAANLAYAQNNLLFEDIEFTNSMRLVVMHPHYDERSTYESYDLIIDDKKTFDSLRSSLTYGSEVTNFWDRNEPSIILLDGDQSIKRWAINPMKASIRIDGKSYRFNTDLIQELASKYPLNYSTEKTEFTSPEEFEEFRSQVQNDQSYLFMYKPNFDYQGFFEVRFMRSNKFRHPKDIDPFLRPQLKKITSEEEFRISYVANEYNLSHRNQFTMKVDANKNLYEQFNGKKCEKLGWTDAVYTATVFKQTTYNSR